MPDAKILKVSLILICLALFGYTAVKTDNRQLHNISVDLSRPVQIVWPFETAVVGPMGQKGLRIGANIGRGWKGEAGGNAAYKFYIQKQDQYRIWAYCLWYDECANAVYIKIDNSDKAILGNDPIYQKWHWVRGFDINLKKGTHSLLLSNHSDHISIQKLLFTNSESQKLEQFDAVFSDIFYDGFDGCDEGNFKSWKIVSGRWRVLKPQKQMCYSENALLGKSRLCSLIIYNKKNFSEYCLNAATRFAETDKTQGSAGMCFAVKNKNRYHQLKWQLMKNTHRAKIQLVKKNGDQDKPLKTFHVPWDKNKWHLIGIQLNTNDLIVTIDESKPVRIPLEYTPTGGIGLRLEGNVAAYFDEIHVRKQGKL